MAKRRKSTPRRSPAKKQTGRSGRKLSNDQQLEMLGNEFSSFRIRNTHNYMNVQRDLHEIKRETVSLSRVFGAMLDLISDVSSVPQSVITERFIFYCNERDPVDQAGVVKGSLRVTEYNLCGEVRNEGSIV